MNFRSESIYQRLSAIVIAFILILGCSSGYKLGTAKVRGTVTLDGRPLDGGVVIFRPTKGRAAVGKIQSDGTYKLFTYIANGEDGAIVGRHKVVVSQSAAASELPDAPVAKSRLPTKYQHEGTSGLEFDVKDQPENVIDIKLSSSGIPSKS